MTVSLQTIDVLRTKAAPMGIELVIGSAESFRPADDYFGALLQYPGVNGDVRDYTSLIEACHQHEVWVTLAADIMSLAMLKTPGEMGADCAVGNSQRFGVPMGFGGPHAAYFATKDEFKRVIPGRIIGVSIDRRDKPALRMALQTREQHIRREKRPPIFVQPRHCWPSWPVCMPPGTDRWVFAILQATSTAMQAGCRKHSQPWALKWSIKLVRHADDSPQRTG